MSVVPRDYVEVQIPLSKGVVRGKWWGPTNRRPILAMHGWMDNSGTFDRLIPYLPPEIGILAIDKPGHGYSDHLPQGSNYNYFLEPVLLHEIFTHFKWTKISLLGHSIGALEQSLYSAMFPDTIDFFIAIDMLYSLVTTLAISKPNIEEYGRRINQLVKAFIKIDKNEEPKSYPYDMCVQGYCSVSRGSLTPEHAKTILKRGLKPSRKYENQFYFSADERLKILCVPSISHEQYLEMLLNIKAPMLLIKSELAEKTKSSDEYFEKVVSELRSRLKVFEVVKVNGKHHLHLTAPETIGPMISKFILKFDSKEREQKHDLINEIRYAKNKL